ncbi:LysR family transcriptional regulator [Corynebacterium sp. L4756]|uniref:LysR family transcriptional regulator n=1 Tax=unclassified Corynebacterium TaxID=2624378 RepID=UPI00374CF311
MLDLHRLRILRELRRLGTVTAVAELMNYTHSAISQQLAQCEKDAGVKLYERAGRRIVLTEQGELLADYANELLALADSALSAVLDSTSQVRGRIRVASFQTVLASILPNALDNLSEQYPDLKVEITQLEIENAVPALANGTVDLILGEDYPGVVPLTDNTVHREHLIDDELVLITPAESTLTFEEVIARGNGVGAVVFALDSVDYSLGKFFHAFCRQHGIEPNVLFETPDPFLQTHLTRTGHACSVTSALFGPLQPGVRFVHLPDRPHRTLYTAVRAGRENHPALRAFREALVQSVENTAKEARALLDD